ncbi:hypothetical protein [Colwellia sp. E2M01]|uniref:hypothetical protein n=1 Tax=Colwellia sp. E2M01 TaxID=2841561 RepID=UPI001C096382|nr:hypothetical protein [Colwellia sp. E2M01]MBU2870185.1 hypothetical protein [Colwellia sp. E2M01]
MPEQLPIIIKVNRDLVANFAKINAVCNKLEAQFNFQTLTANWYGDEENIVTITLFLETAESYIFCEGELKFANLDLYTIKYFSDDVVCRISRSKPQIDCYIAMTAAELELLRLQAKVLPSLIQVKLRKVLNLIADEKSLPLIP